MYTKLYKRSAEKWQKVAISQKSKKVYILSGPFWDTLTEKIDSGYIFYELSLMTICSGCRNFIIPSCIN